MANKVHAGPAEASNPLMVEATAVAALPGKVVTKTGGAFALGDGATTGALMFLKEKGPGEGGRIDLAFTAGEAAQAYVAKSGHFFRARALTGLALVAGETLLERGADGDLQAVTTGDPVAVARESKTTAANDELILVEVL